MAFLGIVAAGMIFTGTNPGYTEYELVHHMKTARVKFLLAEPEFLETTLAAASKCGLPLSNVRIFNVHKQNVPVGFKSWEDLMDQGEQDWVRFDDKKTSSTTTAARLFSSGTTGLPKAASLTHYNLVSQHTLVVDCFPKPWDTRRLQALPMFHAACVPSAHTSALKAGHQTFVMQRFDLEPFLANIEKYAITDVTIVPPIVIAVIMSPITMNYSLKSIRFAQCGAAALGRGPQSRIQALLADGATFTQVWGMTETCCIGSMLSYDEDDHTGSVGRFLPNLDVKIIDDEGNDITDYNTPGELTVRGPTIIPEYFDNPTANAQSFDSDGFFKTGDVVYCDKDSKLWYVIDRKKELIKVRGFQVAPPEIEAVLLSHPQIVDAGVIGVVLSQEERDGEAPRAYVTRRPGEEGAKLDEKAVRAWCSARLAKYKDLTGGVYFVDAIPKNASGKILKRVLREWAKDAAPKEKARL
ncbi:hypothetical protein BP5796_10651 [Coleophoma crateriformis]|uniref:Acetyl-CoA synthetase-like protein n=1 Tax=Coleophoma crateriformis TaxID=565419 RepID=A0A3D8QQR8_9HELO|nr:hypothetical protein BP5796_10651 [Coleophoma crateriformis]